MDQAQLQIQNEHRSQQTKYRYYIIGLSVTCVGFSVYQTTGQSLSFYHIPLALSIISWGISIYLGLKYLQYFLSILYADNALFKIRDGHEETVGSNPLLIKTAIDGVTEAIKNNIKKSAKLANWQERFFYIGSFLFIIWHIITMYNIS